MEFISLGGLVAGLSIDAVLMGASQPRNEKLAALFYRMKLIESYGIGIGKIMDAYKEVSAKPTFEAAQGAFRVVLPNIHAQQNASHVRVLHDVPIIDRPHREVLVYLERHPSVTRQAIEELLNVKTTRANDIIKEMISLEYLEKQGNGKNTRYTRKQ